ncbi:MAG TPA: DegT/DnrJ/EryC1/StrS family aminotransferase [Bacteroidales bacterium]|jgi:perosamine synthetase|nr:DegT/DnrJ/EryC1/StrS family aminotransferase [Bacteroidales bacterium]
MEYRIQQIQPFFDEQETRNLEKAISTGWVTEGPFSQEFLTLLKEFTGARYAVLANNGTLGLYLALLAIGAAEGDEVIVPDFTFNASASSIAFTGAEPVFTDINKNDLQINASGIEGLITPRTKAIMPVHIYGQSCDMDPIVDIAKKHNLKIVEDAAQGFGVFYKGKHTGTIGDVGVISFFADKTITTGEGAVILTNNEAIFNRLKMLRNQGRPNSGTFIHPELGMNFRMTDLQCAVGVAQFKKFAQIKEIKLRNFNRYKELLSGIPQIEFVQINDFTNFIPFRVNIKVPDVEGLIAHLENNAIQTRRMFYPLHRQPCFKFLNYDDAGFSASIDAYDRGISFPVHCRLKDEDIVYLCDQVKAFYKR